MSANKQKGFAFFEVILVIAIVAVIGMVGFKIYNNRAKTVSSETSASNTSQKEPANANVSTAPSVNSSSDLDKAQATLDQNDPSSANSVDSAQLDSDSASL